MEVAFGSPSSKEPPISDTEKRVTRGGWASEIRGPKSGVGGPKSGVRSRLALVHGQDARATEGVHGHPSAMFGARRDRDCGPKLEASGLIQTRGGANATAGPPAQRNSPALSPRGRGWPAAGVLTSRSGEGAPRFAGGGEGAHRLAAHRAQRARKAADLPDRSALRLLPSTFSPSRPTNFCFAFENICFRPELPRNPCIVGHKVF
jgi:hypothetical protein